MNKYIKYLIEGFFDDIEDDIIDDSSETLDNTFYDKDPNFGLFNILIKRIKDDLKYDTYSGFSVMLSKKYKVMQIWDINGNQPTYKEPCSAPLDKDLYNNFIKYLDSKYILELEDTNNLGAEESYKYIVQPKK